MKNRLLWLDIAKGITIILMVLGHSSLPEVLSNFIYAFHMPLFFVASGYTSNWKKTGIYQFACNKARTILIPFVTYSVILWVMTQFTSEAVNLLELLKKGWLSWALWFVPVLYVALVVCRVVFEFHNDKLRCLAVICLLLLGLVLSYFKFHLPWNISTVPIAVTYLYIGSLFNSYKICERFHQWWLIILCFVLTATVSYYWKLDLCFNKILPIIPLLIASLAGTYMVFCVSKFIEWHCSFLSKVMTRIGRETFVILALSQVIIVLINNYLFVNAAVKYLLLVFALVLFSFFKNLIRLKTN